MRCIQCGLRPSDLDDYSLGAIFDIFTENENDGAKYDYVATQEDFDKF